MGKMLRPMLALIVSLLFASCFAKISDNHWFVLIGTSKFFFNYRHTSNVLAVYQILKSHGVSDDRIILMITDNYACNPRNTIPGTIYFGRTEDVYSSNIEVDYRDDDVSPDAILNLFRGRYPPNFPISKKLLSDANSTVTMYISSHAGEEFIKIQDTDVITTEDFARAMMEMHLKGRYRKLGIFLDTCRAATFFNNMEAPNAFMMASSAESEDSRSHIYKDDLGVYTNDMFSHFFVRYMKTLYQAEYEVATLQELYDYLSTSVRGATVKYKFTFEEKELSKFKLSEFWGTPGQNTAEKFKFVGEDELKSIFG